MARRKKDLSSILHDVYVDLYKNAEPSEDFDYLVENAAIGDDGKKIIPYNDYEIDDTIMDNIVNYHIKGNKLSESDASSIRFYAYLGCSPRSKPKVND